jgi:hypothetical protein
MKKLAAGSENACYQSVQNLLSSYIPPKIQRLKYIKLKFYLLFCVTVKFVFFPYPKRRTQN